MTQATLDYVTLPNDGSNTGAKTPTMAKVIGVNTLEYPLVIQAREQTVKGVYRASMTAQSVAAAAQNATATGFLWITVPAATTTRAVRLRKADIILQHSAITATAMATLPRIGIARFTFTGTASGATLAGAKIDPDAANPSVDMRTAVTGLTVTLNTDPGSLLQSVIVPPYLVLGAPTANIGLMATDVQSLVSIDAEEDEWPIIKAGQGLVIYQLDAGTASDSRRFGVNLLWDEIEL